MSLNTYIRTGLYLALIWIGYLSAEYPVIPSFNIHNSYVHLTHTQPPIEIYDKGISIILLFWAVTLLIIFWENFWIRVSMIFITGGMIGNAFDEISDQGELFSHAEQLALVLAFLTSTLLILNRYINGRKSNRPRHRV